jgi:bifunctional DNA-binding transcriptional regulator/antitoxin component of YhaV-PrlF toxin-antitoxin module
MALTTMMDGSGRIVLPKQIREEMRMDYGVFLVVEKESDDAIRLRIVRTDTRQLPSVKEGSGMGRLKIAVTSNVKS